MGCAEALPRVPEAKIQSGGTTANTKVEWCSAIIERIKLSTFYRCFRFWFGAFDTRQKKLTENNKML